jgi:hypothetical protein
VCAHGLRLLTSSGIHLGLAQLLHKGKGLALQATLEPAVGCVHRACQQGGVLTCVGGVVICWWGGGVKSQQRIQAKPLYAARPGQTGGGTQTLAV